MNHAGTILMDDRERNNPYALAVAIWNWNNTRKTPTSNGSMYVGHKEYFPTLCDVFTVIGAEASQIDPVYDLLLRQIRDDAEIRKMSYYGDVTIYAHRAILEARAKPRIPLLIIPTKSGCETAMGGSPLSVENALRVARMGQPEGERFYGILMFDGGFLADPTQSRIIEEFERSENFASNEREQSLHGVSMSIPTLEQFLSGIPYSVRTAIDSKGTTVRHTVEQCFAKMSSDILHAIARGATHAVISKFQPGRDEFICDWSYSNGHTGSRFAGGVLVRRIDGEKWEVSMHS